MQNTIDSVKTELDQLKALTQQAITQLNSGAAAPPTSTGDQAEIDAMASEIQDLSAQLQAALGQVPTPGAPSQGLGGGIPPAPIGPASPPASNGPTTTTPPSTNPPTIPGATVPPSSATPAGSPPPGVATPPSLIGAVPPVGQGQGSSTGSPVPVLPAEG